MIQLIKQGDYQLIETKRATKILNLADKGAFAWVNAAGIGWILVSTHKKHSEDCILAVGKYRLYNVKGEADLTDTLHLELSTGRGKWQGYLLIKGFPNDEDKKNRIIPTKELITKSVGVYVT